ncbi:hypothetical protein ENUP19_0290G0008, partial [Entamoeba nuttalli]
QEGPVAQSVVHRTYRKEKCEGRGFDPRRDHFIFSFFIYYCEEKDIKTNEERN